MESFRESAGDREEDEGDMGLYGTVGGLTITSLLMNVTSSSNMPEGDLLLLPLPPTPTPPSLPRGSAGLLRTPLTVTAPHDPVRGCASASTVLLVAALERALLDLLDDTPPLLLPILLLLLPLPKGASLKDVLGEANTSEFIIGRVGRE